MSKYQTIQDDITVHSYVINIAMDMEDAYNRYVESNSDFKQLANTFSVNDFDLVVEKAIEMRDAYAKYNKQYKRLSQLCYGLGGKYIDICERAVRHQEVIV